MKKPKYIVQARNRFLDGGIHQDMKRMADYGLSLLVPLGKPGAGKGTHMERLVEEFDVQKFTTGDIFRNPSRAGCFTDQQAKDLADLCQYHVIEQKNLLPDDLTTKAVIQYLSHNIENNSFNPREIIIADVFPRTLNQFYLAEHFAHFVAFLYFDVTDELSLIRQRHRAKNSNRPDNGQEVERLKEYYSVTHPLVEHLQTNNAYRLQQIDSSKDIDEVYYLTRVAIIDELF